MLTVFARGHAVWQDHAEWYQRWCPSLLARRTKHLRLRLSAFCSLSNDCERVRV